MLDHVHGVLAMKVDIQSQDTVTGEHLARFFLIGQ